MPRTPMSRPHGRRGPRFAPLRDWGLKALRDEDGTTAVEYAVMLALILSGIVGTVATIGGTTGGMFDNAENELKAVGIG